MHHPLQSYFLFSGHSKIKVFFRTYGKLPEWPHISRNETKRWWTATNRRVSLAPFQRCSKFWYFISSMKKETCSTSQSFRVRKVTFSHIAVFGFLRQSLIYIRWHHRKTVDCPLPRFWRTVWQKQRFNFVLQTVRHGHNWKNTETRREFCLESWCNVTVNLCFSKLQSVTGGVPRADRLGAMFFLLFPNNLPDSLVHSLCYG